MSCYAYKDHQPRIHPTAFVAPTAQIIGQVSVGKKSSVWFQAVIRGDEDRITIGDGTNIQDQTTCHADDNVPLTIGNGVIVGHNCVVHGCTIEDDCLIGMGAVVMNHCVVGRGSVIAAGAVVLEGTIVPPHSLVAGSPAVIKKTYDNADQVLAHIQKGAQTYVDGSRNYLNPEIFRPLD